MKWRVLKIGAGVLILAFLAWFGSHLRFEETQVPLPLKGEALSNPYYAAIKLSAQLDAHAAWERVFTTPGTDTVILISNWNWTLSRGRRERIETWVEQGGRLVVDGSLLDGSDAFKTWSGVGEVEREDPEESDTADETQKPDARKQKQRRSDQDDRALIEQFMDARCTELTEDDTQRSLSVCGLDESRSLTSTRKLQWALRDGSQLEALRVAVGRGSVTVLNASPFRYREFFQGDHPALFVAATQLHHGDHVMFLTEEEHASLMTLVWRFGAPVVLLLGVLIGLSLWRNTSRFGPLAAAPEKARRSLAEQIRGTGEFTLRFGGGRALHTAMVRALREAALKRLPGYDRLSGEERVAAIAKLTGVLASELEPALNYSGTRSSHELRNVIAVLESARRRLNVTHKLKGQTHGN